MCLLYFCETDDCHAAASVNRQQEANTEPLTSFILYCISLSWAEINMHCSHSDSQLWASMKSKQTYDSCVHCCAPPMNPYLSVCLSVKPLISESDPKELSSSMWLLLIVRILLVSTDWRPFSILAILARELTGWREKLTSASWLTDKRKSASLLMLYEIPSAPWFSDLTFQIFSGNI